MYHFITMHLTFPLYYLFPISVNSFKLRELFRAFLIFSSRASITVYVWWKVIFHWHVRGVYLKHAWFMKDLGVRRLGLCALMFYQMRDVWRLQTTSLVKENGDCSDSSSCEDMCWRWPKVRVVNDIWTGRREKRRRKEGSYGEEIEGRNEEETRERKEKEGRRCRGKIM